MAGSASNWFKVGSADAKGTQRVFVSNASLQVQIDKNAAVYAKSGVATVGDLKRYYGRKIAKGDAPTKTFLTGLSKFSKQPAGQAQKKAPVSAQAGAGAKKTGVQASIAATLKQATQKPASTSTPKPAKPPTPTNPPVTSATPEQPYQPPMHVGAKLPGGIAKKYKASFSGPTTITVTSTGQAHVGNYVMGGDSKPTPIAVVKIGSTYAVVNTHDGKIKYAGLTKPVAQVQAFLYAKKKAGNQVVAVKPTSGAPKSKAAAAKLALSLL